MSFGTARATSGRSSRPGRRCVSVRLALSVGLRRTAPILEDLFPRRYCRALVSALLGLGDPSAAKKREGHGAVPADGCRAVVGAEQVSSGPRPAAGVHCDGECPRRQCAAAGSWERLIFR